MQCPSSKRCTGLVTKHVFPATQAFMPVVLVCAGLFGIYNWAAYFTERLSHPLVEEDSQTWQNTCQKGTNPCAFCLPEKLVDSFSLAIWCLKFLRRLFAVFRSSSPKPTMTDVNESRSCSPRQSDGAFLVRFLVQTSTMWFAKLDETRELSNFSGHFSYVNDTSTIYDIRSM